MLSASTLRPIVGYNVHFPASKRPFPSQLALMSKVLLALRRGQHALLESPTGTGKTLALLAATLTWQMAQAEAVAAADQPMVNDDDSDAASEEEEETDVVASSTTSSGAVTLEYEHGGNSSSSSDSDFDPVWSSDASRKRRRARENKKKIPPPPPPKPPKASSSSTTATASKKKTRKEKEHLPSKEKGKGKGKQRQERRGHRRRRVPTIFFTSRTHSQLAQVINETRRLPEEYIEGGGDGGRGPLRISLLGARRHYCTNPEANASLQQQQQKKKKKKAKKKGDTSRGVDEECKRLLAENSCTYMHGVHRFVKSHAEAHLPPVWDIEDAVSAGGRARACPYYASRALIPSAHLVFCPYSFLVDPIVRSAMNINLKGAVVVMDECHNIEDVLREAASAELTLDRIQRAAADLSDHRDDDSGGNCCLAGALTGLSEWLSRVTEHQSRTASGVGFGQSQNVWRGEEIVVLLQENAGVARESMEALRAELDELTAESHRRDDGRRRVLRGDTLVVAGSLFNVWGFLFQNNLANVRDYRLAVTKSRAFNPRKGRGGGSTFFPQWTVQLCFWCLNPALAFAKIGGEARSVILASGTLAPMDSFAGELGVAFPIRLESPHVIDTRKQLWVGQVSTSGGVQLRSTFQQQDSFSQIDALGHMVVSLCGVVPGGALLFFPSFSYLRKVETRWRSTGLMHALEQRKRAVVEPRGASDAFDAVLADFYSAIDGGGGAILFAVFRGKASEGIDFSDERARAVICVGIPFPNLKDLNVDQKRKYQTERSKIRPEVLDGNKWYRQAAFRALNQALGRCVRHRHDYGAIVLADCRFESTATLQYLSSWVRGSVQKFGSSERAVGSLAQFFAGMSAPTTSADPAPAPEALVEQLQGRIEEEGGEEEEQDDAEEVDDAEEEDNSIEALINAAEAFSQSSCSQLSVCSPGPPRVAAAVTTATPPQRRRSTESGNASSPIDPVEVFEDLANVAYVFAHSMGEIYDEVFGRPAYNRQRDGTVLTRPASSGPPPDLAAVLGAMREKCERIANSPALSGDSGWTSVRDAWLALGEDVPASDFFAKFTSVAHHCVPEALQLSDCGRITFRELYTRWMRCLAVSAREEPCLPLQTAMTTMRCHSCNRALCTVNFHKSELRPFLPKSELFHNCVREATPGDDQDDDSRRYMAFRLWSHETHWFSQACAPPLRPRDGNRRLIGKKQVAFAPLFCHGCDELVGMLLEQQEAGDGGSDGGAAASFLCTEKVRIDPTNP